MKPDWILDHIDTGTRSRFFVQGHFANSSKFIAAGDPFSWHVDSIADPRYDKSNATITDAARAAMEGSRQP